MPMAIPIVAAGFIGAGAAIGASLGTAFVIGGLAVSVGAALTVAGVGLMAASVLTMKKPKANSGLESAAQGQQLGMKLDGKSPIPIAYGRTASGGYAIYRKTQGSKNELLAIAAVLSAGGPIQQIESYRAADRTVSFPVDPTASSTLALGIGDDSGLYVNKLRMRYQLGETPASETLSQASFIGLPGTPGKLSGLAHALQINEFDQKAYPQGLPKSQWTIKGVKLYDPRKDSTYPGGSGAHRRDNKTTWEFSENPFLSGLDWCFGRWENGKKVYGIGAKWEEVDVSAFVQAANVADANNWKMGGVVTTDDDKYAVLASILQAGGGLPVARGAQISCTVNSPKASVFTITSADVIGEVEIQNTTSWRDRKNAIIPRYREETQLWEMIAGQEVSAENYVTDDGGEKKTAEVEFPLVQQAAQAHQLATYELVNSREFLTVNITGGPRLLNVRVGEACTVNIPELALNNQKCLVVARELNPADLTVTVSLKSETDSKHAFALGQSQTPPPSPALSGFDPSRPPAPGATSWAITFTEADGGAGVIIPLIVINGEVDDPYAREVIVDYRETGTADWASVGSYGADVTNIEIGNLLAGKSYDIAISYRSILGVQSAPLLLSATAGRFQIDYAAGVIGGATAPEPNATVGAPNGTMVGGVLAQTLVGNVATLQAGYQANSNNVALAQSAQSAAEAARNAAQGYRDVAQTASNNANTANTQAGAARDAANTAKGAAETAANLASDRATAAGGSATAAAGSANTATTKAGEASTSATSASGSANVATSKATEATNSANAASTSASAASTSSSAAATSASSAQSSSVVAKLGAAETFPSDMKAGAPFMANAALSPTAGINQTYGPEYYAINNGETVWRGGGAQGHFRITPVAAFMPIPGHTYEIECRWGITQAATNNPTSNVAAIDFLGLDANYNITAGYLSGPTTGYVASESISTLTPWRVFKGRWTVPASGAPMWARPSFFGNYNGSGTHGNAVYDVRYLKLTDITAQAAAEAQAGAAATSASNAAFSNTAAGNSASAANTSATQAGTAFSNANAAAGQANTYAGNAATSASQASTSASNAAGSANTASSQAILASNASTSAANSTALSFPRGFTTAEQQFWSHDENQVTTATPAITDLSYFGSDPNYPVYVTKPGISLSVGSKGTFRPLLNRRYRCTVTISRTTNVGGVSYGYFGFVKKTNSGAIDYSVSAINMAASPYSAWQSYSHEWVCDSNSYAWARPRLHWNWDNGTGAAISAHVYHIQSIVFEDITDSTAAASSASAALTSSQTATTKATEAGTSATTASQQAQNSQVNAANASTSATAASGFATAATNSAAAAQSSFNLTSQVGLGTVNLNPIFANWPDGQQLPTNWSAWDGDMSRVARVAGINGKPYALKQDSNTNNNLGVQQTITSAAFGRWVLEVTVQSDNGWGGAGILYYGLNTDTGAVLHEQRLSFYDTPDSSGWTSFNDLSTVYVRTFSMYIENPINGALRTHVLYLMNNWNGHTGGNRAKTTFWHSVRFRAATDAEIAGKKAIVDAASALANVSSLSNTVTSDRAAAASRSDAVESKIALSGNALGNTDWPGGDTAGWFTNLPAGNFFMVNGAGDPWHPVGINALTINQTSGQNGGSIATDVSLEVGQVYQISCKVAAHRAKVELVAWRLDNNTNVSSGSITVGTGGQSLNGFTTVAINFVAQTSRYRFELYKSNTMPANGDSTSWMWMCHPSITRVARTDATYVGYMPGSGKLAAESLNARITQEATTRTDVTGALANRVSNVESSAGSLSSRVTTTENAITGLNGRSSSYWQVTSVAGNGRAQMRVWSDSNGGGGVDITGDVRIKGIIQADAFIDSQGVDLRAIVPGSLNFRLASSAGQINTSGNGEYIVGGTGAANFQGHQIRVGMSGSFASNQSSPDPMGLTAVLVYSPNAVNWYEVGSLGTAFSYGSPTPFSFSQTFYAGNWGGCILAMKLVTGGTPGAIYSPYMNAECAFFR